MCFFRALYYSRKRNFLKFVNLYVLDICIYLLTKENPFGDVLDGAIAGARASLTSDFTITLFC